MKNFRNLGEAEFVILFGIVMIVDAIISGQFAAGLGNNFPFFALLMMTSVVTILFGITSYLIVLSLYLLIKNLVFYCFG